LKSQKNYSNALQEDFLIREYLTKQMKPTSDAGLSKVIISRRGEKLLVEVHVAQPKLVTGENGSRLKELTEGIQKVLRKNQENLMSSADSETQSEDYQTSVSLQIVQVAQPATDATLVAQKVAQQLEKRVAFRRVMKQTIQQAKEAGVEGIKVQIAGRLNGAEIARTEWAREGRVPLHTLRADIDYCAYPAQTIYGLLGIKIWIYKAPARLA